MTPSSRSGLPDALVFGIPTEEFLEGTSKNFQWLGDAELRDFIAVYKAEAELISKLSVSREESRRMLDSCWRDDYLDWPESYEYDIGPFHLADPGVASTVTALSLMGALPYRHCVGTHGHEEERAQVSFWGEEEVVQRVKAVSEENGITFECDFEGSEIDGLKAQFLVSTEGATSLMRNFALALASHFSHTSDPDRLEELETLRATAGRFEIPPWLSRE